MPVREFRDPSGREWRAWDINPDSIHPQTRAEDYLADCYELGWIVFEALDGSDKRRLCPYPHGWETLPESEMRVLLEKAERIAPSRLAKARRPAPDAGRTPSHRRRSADHPASPTESSEESPDVTDLGVVRSFKYPGGRVWSVSVMRPEDASAQILRFSAGARHIDLVQWPRDWPDYPDDRLIELLRQASPRAAGAGPPAGVPGRRHTDRRA